MIAQREAVNVGLPDQSVSGGFLRVRYRVPRSLHGFALESAAFAANTSAALGTRTVGLEVRSQAGTAFVLPPAADQLPSATAYYIFSTASVQSNSDALPAFDTTLTVNNTPVGSLRVFENDEILMAVDNPQAGDTITNVGLRFMGLSL